MFTFSPQLFAVSAVGVLLAVGGSGITGYVHGLHTQQGIDAQAERDRLAKVVVKKDKQAVVTAKASQTGEEHQQQIRIVYRTITKRIPADDKIDHDYGTLPWRFVRMHDGAVRGYVVSEPAGQSDDTRSTVTMSAAEQLLVDNYVNACEANASQLNDLEGWVRDQQSLDVADGR